MKFLVKAKHKDENKSCVDFKIRGKMAGITYPCMVEVKYDGVSVTVEKVGNLISIHTSKSTRVLIPDSYGELYEDGIYLAEWVHNDGVTRPGRWDTLKLVTDGNQYYTMLKFFDVLVCKGVDMSRKDLLTRKEVLAHSVSSGVLTKSKICMDEPEVQNSFERAISKNAEGIIVKNLNESFLTQKWVKLKPPERMTHGSTTTSDE